jgi:hypothetical protein
MVSALALGFFVSPLLMNVINQKLGGVAFEENNPWHEILSFFGRQDSPSEEPLPTEVKPKVPIIPNQAFSVKFSSFTFWRLQLGFSNKREWALEERQRLFDLGIQMYYEDSAAGVILFLGPFLNSTKAEEQSELAKDLGYPDAFPVVWEWPEIESRMIESDDELYNFAKAVTAYNLLANLVFSDQPNKQILNTELQNLLNTKYTFATTEQESMWNESVKALQNGVNQEEDILILKEDIMLCLNDFRNLFEEVAKAE